MPREFINPPDLSTPPSNMYNHVVKVGNTLYIAGQVSRGLDGKTVHAGDVAAQVRQVWANLEKAVTAGGGTLKDIVKTTTYVVGAENLGKVREARLAILPPEGRPTSTTLVVAGLADPDLMVEVEAIAVLGE
ncbi:MAG: RidA family protein [Dehalococcoidia bacterium]